MTIEIKIQNDEKTIYDSIVLTQEMMLELIDNNPTRLKQIVFQMCENIPKMTKKMTENRTPESKKGMSYLMAAAVKFTSSE